MRIFVLLPLLMVLGGCAKDDRPICPSCGERATMIMHPRMPEIAEMGWAQTHYKCENNHNFTRGGELVDAFGMPLKKESVKQIKELITKNESALDSVTFEELENREGMYHLKGSNIPYTGEAFGLHGNEQKRYKIIFKKGNMDGLSMTWYENGKKKHYANWKEGIADGLETQWYPNGQKKLEGSFEKGTPIGLFEAWHENGKKKKEETYQNGVLIKISAKYWNSKGEPVDSIEEAQK